MWGGEREIYRTVDRQGKQLTAPEAVDGFMKEDNTGRQAEDGICVMI